MNKIVIVGHPQSGYQEVESLLNACGMATAQPSRREGFLPEQISATLCKVHSTAALNQVQTVDQIQQIEAGPVWHGMALDLMLGNLDQPIWGWADPQSIYLLNYWRDLDPNITFILVYDRPHTVLTQAAPEEMASLSPQDLSQCTRQWAAYNAALLHFYHRNPQRCLLVHSQQVRESASSYLQQVRTRINAPWPDAMGQLASPQAATQTTAEAASPWPESSTSHTGHTNHSGSSDSHSGSVTTPTNTTTSTTTHHAAIDILQADPQPLGQHPAEPAPQALALFVADALLRQHPASLQLYQELQAVANLPLADGADTVVHAHTALQAWHAMSTQRLQLKEQNRQVDQLQHAKAEAEARILQAAQEHARLITEQAAAQQRTTQLNQQVDALKRQLADNQVSAEESALLLNQLHQVQEELERHYTDKQAQAQQLQALQQAHQQATEQQKKLEAQAAERQQQLDQLQAQLKQRTEQAKTAAQAAEKAQVAAEQANAAAQQRTTQLNQQVDALKRQLADNQVSAEESALLLNQLHQVQEELERHYTDKQAQAKQLQALQQAHQQATEQQKKLEAQAAERQQQLDQLQAQLKQRTEQAKTAAQAAEKVQVAAAQAVKQAQAKAAEAAKQAQERAAQVLQLTQAKADADKQAAERLQQIEKQRSQLDQQVKQAQAKASQLEAQLATVTAQAAAASQPNPALEQENDLLLTQLHQVQEELERYYREAQEQAKKLQALEVIQQESTYHQQVINELQTELQTLKSAPPKPEQAIAVEQLLAQLLKAQEAQERQFHATSTGPSKVVDEVYPSAVDRVQQHLSYRLGNTMVQRSGSFTGWVGMPFALVKTAREYRREQASNAVTPLQVFSSPQEKRQAEELKQHLPYRLGSTLIAHVRSPIGWVKLPFALSREAKAFKQSKNA